VQVTEVLTGQHAHSLCCPVFSSNALVELVLAVVTLVVQDILLPPMPSSKLRLDVCECIMLHVVRATIHVLYRLGLVCFV
jgi:hypothetical protein